MLSICDTKGAARGGAGESRGELFPFGGSSRLLVRPGVSVGAVRADGAMDNKNATVEQTKKPLRVFWVRNGNVRFTDLHL